jgi:hypothetical protein
MGLITESALLRALQSWVFRKTVAIEEILLEQQAFNAESCRFLKEIAEDLELNLEVALKEIQPDYVRDASSRTRFVVEAEITGRLEHPGIVAVYSMGTTSSGTPFYVMRFIRGDWWMSATRSSTPIIAGCCTGT